MNEFARSAFALAIAQGHKVAAAADIAGVTRGTGYKLARDPVVARLANQYRDRIVAETIGRVVAMGTRATERLAELIDSDDDAVALKASIAVVAEVRRIADASGAGREALPVIERPPSREEAVSKAIDDARMSHALQHSGSDKELVAFIAGRPSRDQYKAIESRNRSIDKKKQDFLEHELLATLEAANAE